MSNDRAEAAVLCPEALPFLVCPPAALHPPASMPWQPSLWKTSSSHGCLAWHLGSSFSSLKGSVSLGAQGVGPGWYATLIAIPFCAALIYGSACLTVAALSSMLGGGVLQVRPQPHLPRTPQQES